MMNIIIMARCRFFTGDYTYGWQENMGPVLAPEAGCWDGISIIPEGVEDDLIEAEPAANANA